MSLSDVSSGFSFSSYRPVLSEDGRHLAYLNSTKLIIRSTDTLERTHSIDVLPISSSFNQTSSSMTFLKVTQISWEPMFKGRSHKIAVLIDSMALIRIFDISDPSVDVRIQETDSFGIESFHWLDGIDDDAETAYIGPKQLVVFLKCGLLARIYSLDYKKEIFEFEKPLFDKVFKRKTDGQLFHLFSAGHNLDVINSCLVNRGSSSAVLFKSSIGSSINTSDIKISNDDNWIALNSSEIGMIKVNLFSIMGDLSTENKSLFCFKSESDPLGGTYIEFMNKELLLVGDHNETVHVLEIPTGLKPKEILTHRVNLTEETNIWRQNSDDTKFIRKSQPYKVPQLTNLDLSERGIGKIITSNDMIFTTCHSMPTSVFVWSNEDDMKFPTDVITINSIVRDIKSIDKIHSSVMIVSDTSISLWIKSLSIPISIPFSTDDGLIRGVDIIRASIGSIKLLVWTSGKTFKIVERRLSTKSQFDNMDIDEIDSLRKGSPALTDDISRVVELAAGVQQSEWGQNISRNFQNEDTFLAKKKPRT